MDDSSDGDNHKDRTTASCSIMNNQEVQSAESFPEAIPLYVYSDVKNLKEKK